MQRLFDEAHQPHEKHLPYPQPWEFVHEHFFHNVKNKFFIEIGASNGLDSSNTSLFEFYLNWNGICIEPNKVQYDKLIKNRNCKTYNCCVGNENAIKQFLEIKGPVSPLSGLMETYDPRHLDRIAAEVNKTNDVIEKKNIEVKTLATIMNENNITHVDYLSIDVEGAELQVLEGIDFKNHNIDVISLEDNGYTDEPKLFLLNKNYQFITKICSDLIFKKLT
jgi:FkbM family methyltransferase